MGREYEPTVGQWYDDLENDETFQVLKVDEDGGNHSKFNISTESDTEELDVDDSSGARSGTDRGAWQFGQGSKAEKDAEDEDEEDEDWDDDEDDDDDDDDDDLDDDEDDREEY